jgi:hypothetical protein
MLNQGTHMLCGKASLKAASFTVVAMGTEWSQRSGTIPARPESNYKLDMTGAVSQEGWTD